ncbi:transposase [Rhodococcus sp. As11]|uniref:transposase n=1 Tax=Rhodococcus sp. As11 TaxID=3029189 RepID=UPI003B7BDBE1
MRTRTVIACPFSIEPTPPACAPHRRRPRTSYRTHDRVAGGRLTDRLNKEIKRRADVVEIFPNPAAFLRLATAVVIEQYDEWQVTRRYVSDVSMDELRAVIAAKEHATEPALSLACSSETA